MKSVIKANIALVGRGALTVLLLCGACLSALGSSYTPENVHSAVQKLPADLRRVAVLPVTSDVCDEDSADALQAVLLEEIAKMKRFEVVAPSAAALKNTTGRESWRAEESLPENFFASLNRSEGCDAVLFVHLTVYRAYGPVAVGWRLKLVDVKTHEILWATDETFDSGNKAVASDAKKYSKAQQGAKGCGGTWSALASPVRFGRYSVSTLLALLPER